MGDDRRFERDDGPIAGERVGDLRRNVEQRFTFMPIAFFQPHANAGADRA